VKKLALYFGIFVLVANVIGWSYFFYAKSLSEAELARGEQTMGPGWTMFIGLIFAPIGGIAAVVLTSLALRWLGRNKKTDATT
jgi:hypothetical protein